MTIQEILLEIKELRDAHEGLQKHLAQLREATIKATDRLNVQSTYLQRALDKLGESL